MWVAGSSGPNRMGTAARSRAASSFGAVGQSGSAGRNLLARLRSSVAPKELPRPPWPPRRGRPHRSRSRRGLSATRIGHSAATSWAFPASGPTCPSSPWTRLPSSAGRQGHGRCLRPASRIHPRPVYGSPISARPGPSSSYCLSGLGGGVLWANPHGWGGIRKFFHRRLDAEAPGAGERAKASRAPRREPVRAAGAARAPHPGRIPVVIGILGPYDTSAPSPARRGPVATSPPPDVRTARPPTAVAVADDPSRVAWACEAGRVR